MSILQTLKLRAAAAPPAWRRRVLSGLGLVLTVAAVAMLGFLVYRERQTLVPRLLTVDPRRLLAVVLLYLLDLAIMIGAWASIANAFGVRVGISRHTSIFCAANAARRLPGTLWYLGGRGVLYARLGVEARPVLLASAVELALLWLAGLALAAPALVAFLPQRQWLASGVSAALLILILNPITLKAALNRATRHDPEVLLPLPRVYSWLLLYMVMWVVGGLVLFAVISLFQPVTLSAAPIVIGAWVVSATVSLLTFFLPSGFGVMELTLAALLSPVLSAGAAVIAALAARLLITLFDVVVGLLFYARETASNPG